jgi:hypothetical protein
VAARALNWKNDPFALGAYSSAMPQTRQALAAIEGPSRSWILLAGEAFYRGRDMGTVEAQGLATAHFGGLRSASR